MEFAGAKIMREDADLHIAEAASAAGISKPTLLRWIKVGKIADAARRDRNDWRLFSPAEVEKIRAYAAATKPSGRRK